MKRLLALSGLALLMAGCNNVATDSKSAQPVGEVLNYDAYYQMYVFCDAYDNRVYENNHGDIFVLAKDCARK